MAITYRKSSGTASNCKDGAAPHSVRVSGDTRPNPGCSGKKLLNPFRDKMRSLRDAVA